MLSTRLVPRRPKLGRCQPHVECAQPILSMSDQTWSALEKIGANSTEFEATLLIKVRPIQQNSAPCAGTHFRSASCTWPKHGQIRTSPHFLHSGQEFATAPKSDESVTNLFRTGLGWPGVGMAPAECGICSYNIEGDSNRNKTEVGRHSHTFDRVRVTSTRVAQNLATSGRLQCLPVLSFRNA